LSDIDLRSGGLAEIPPVFSVYMVFPGISLKIAGWFKSDTDTHINMSYPIDADCTNEHIFRILGIMKQGDSKMSQNEKQNPQPIQATMLTKSMAQLEAEIAEILKKELEDKDISGFVNDGKEFAGYTPEHTINGVPYSKLMEIKQQLEDENS
jgi:hypothetical protein